MIYFVAYSLLGMFFVLAVVIGMFQDVFEDQRKKKTKRDQLLQRVGTVGKCLYLL